MSKLSMSKLSNVCTEVIQKATRNKTFSFEKKAAHKKQKPVKIGVDLEKVAQEIRSVVEDTEVTYDDLNVFLKDLHR